MKRAAQKIMDGLADALAHAKGRQTEQAASTPMKRFFVATADDPHRGHEIEATSFETAAVAFA